MPTPIIDLETLWEEVEDMITEKLTIEGEIKNDNSNK